MSKVQIGGWVLLITGVIALGAAAYESPAILRRGFTPGGLVVAVATEPVALPDVQEIMRGYDAQAAEAQRKLDAELKPVRERTLQQLQSRQDDYTRAAKLDEAVAVRDLIRSLKASWNLGTGSTAALPNPGALLSFADKIGQSFLFEVTGSDSGTIWGTDVYTTDSSLAAAAVHAGALKSGERGVVRVTVLEGKGLYSGCNRNGVTSHSWGSYPASYRVEAVSAARLGVSTAVEDAPTSMTAFRGQINAVRHFRVTGDSSGWTWGSGVYTDDSSLATAAVHAGALKQGERGVVKVTILPGQDSYSGDSRNGVSSRTYGSWPGSFRVEAVGELAR